MKRLFLLSVVLLAFCLAQAQPDSTRKADSTYEKTDQEASFPGGLTAWTTFIVTNIKMDRVIKKAVPSRAKHHWEQTAQVRFIVERDGSLSNIHVVNDVHPEVVREAIRLLSTSLKWEPASQNGRKVRSYYTQPIVFAVDIE